jgi:hypothetical protein
VEEVGVEVATSTEEAIIIIEITKDLVKKTLMKSDPNI